MIRRVLAFGLAFGLFLGLAPVAGADTEAVDLPETVSEELEGLPSAGEPPADLPDEAEAADAESTSEPIEAPMPFTMLGAELPEGADAWVRTSADGQEWGDWVELDPLGEDHEGPDEGSAEDRAAGSKWRQMTEPVWVGEATWLQLTVEGGDTEAVSVTLIDSMGLSRTLGERVRDAFRAAWRGGTATAHAAARPSIISRSGWGANESLRRGSPSYASNVRAVTVHHTAGNNSYTREQAPGIVRGIYHYHTQSLGWSDIGYNMLVDRYGRIYEGRFGGLDRAVIGAHAGGFNSGTFGISILGTFTSVAPTTASFNAMADAIAWKAAIHGVDPKGRVTLTSGGSTRYSAGTRVTLPTIFGHRDVSATECPGTQFYNRLPQLRDRVASLAAQGAHPLAGDWNGDGVSTPGWYHGGRVLLRTSNAAGPADITFSYGRAGDVPIVGDWNGDGKDTIGIVRGREWHLRFTNSGGPADASFVYGRLTSGDYALAGDWNGDGKDTVGIVRRGEWHLRNALDGGKSDLSFVYGRVRSGDVPVVGDWNRNGQDTPGIIRDGGWYLRLLNAGGRADEVFPYGAARDRPVVGDWNRDGHSTPGVVRGTTWHLRNHNSGGAADRSFVYTGY
jgi:hypothetical protein